MNSTRPNATIAPTTVDIWWSRPAVRMLLLLVAILAAAIAGCSNKPSGSISFHPTYACDGEAIEIKWRTENLDRVAVETSGGRTCLDSEQPEGSASCSLGSADLPLTGTGWKDGKNTSLKIPLPIVFCDDQKWTASFTGKERCDGPTHLQLLTVIGIDSEVQLSDNNDYQRFDVEREEVKGIWYQEFDGFYLDVDHSLFSDRVVLLAVRNESEHTLKVTGPSFPTVVMTPGEVVQAPSNGGSVPKPGGGWSMLYEEPELRAIGYQDFELNDSKPIVVCGKKHADLQFLVKCADM
ncbi:MAG: hypothetical protein GY788_17360 [bacterium]|nr:hypothetical protein [bacterium]